MTDPTLLAPAEVVIRLRMWQRIAVGLFGLVWFGGLGVGLYIGLRDSNVPIPAIVMLLFGVFVFGSVLRLRVATSGDRLEVRNAYRTITLRRAEIAEIRIGRGSGGPGARMIVIVPHEGDLVSVDVSGRFLPKRADRLSAELAELRTWHAGSS